MENKIIAIGSDHGGFEYKEKLIDYLTSKKYEVKDVGTYSKESCDYPDIAKELCNTICNSKADCGILICGTGIGMSICANKIKGIRAALCNNTTCAKLSKEHNNSNVLCLGQRITGELLMYEIVDTWLNTEFLGGRHQRRVEKIEEV